MTAIGIVDWKHNPAEQTYTLIADSCRCLVWRTRLGTWAAVVTCNGEPIASYTFATAEEAKAWCEIEVTKQARQ